MKSTRFLVAAFAVAVSLSAQALEVRGFNLTQIGVMKYAANPAGSPKTPAQQAIDYLATLGVKHINLTPEARMATYQSNEVVPVTKLADRAAEAQNYINLIQYIHSKGMTAGIRPIVLVEKREGSDEVYWHGNIQPTEPYQWFESFQKYLNMYVMIGKRAGIEQFTVGAELFSMTVGIESNSIPQEQWYGHPEKWVRILRAVKFKLGPKCKIMYDINYTDASATASGSGPSGGEFERWRYRLADLKGTDTPPTDGVLADDPALETKTPWQRLYLLWKEIDLVGIDMYRSLMPKSENEPKDYNALVARLEQSTGSFASDLNDKLLDIEMAVGFSKKVVIKELGYKSCTRCFIDPFAYDNPSLQVNVPHQAAAYQAFFNAFVKTNLPWMAGVVFWDVSVDPQRQGMLDPGFSPRGKPQTEAIIKAGWGN